MKLLNVIQTLYIKRQNSQRNYTPEFFMVDDRARMRIPAEDGTQRFLKTQPFIPAVSLRLLCHPDQESGADARWGFNDIVSDKTRTWAPF